MNFNWKGQKQHCASRPKKKGVDSQSGATKTTRSQLQPTTPRKYRRSTYPVPASHAAQLALPARPPARDAACARPPLPPASAAGRRVLVGVGCRRGGGARGTGRAAERLEQASDPGRLRLPAPRPPLPWGTHASLLILPRRLEIPRNTCSSIGCASVQV
jgi:hypothetical protein